jgi:hypothetical protein
MSSAVFPLLILLLPGHGPTESCLKSLQI